MTKSRRAVEAAHASSQILRSSVNAVRSMTSHAATKATGFTALRPLVTGLLMLALLFLAVMSLDKFQLWMTAAGLFMVAMSVASAVQEFKFPKTAQSYQDFLDKEMEKCSNDLVSLPHLSPVKNVAEKQEKTDKKTLSSMALNIASPAIVDMSVFPSTLQEKNNRRQSEDSIGALESAVNSTTMETSSHRSSSAELSSTLDVLHCGTVIDIQGSHGFIIPHDMCVDTKEDSKIVRSGAVDANRPTMQHKMPLVIPFNLNDEAAVRQEFAVGNTVEFAFSDPAGSSDSTLCALNVTPVPSDDGIVKSRSALQSLKHCVDLIKYAEKLDDHDAPFDQYI
ncbi:hypothetical protein BBJ29_007468 [Phytophthora kernoviae]|uniref:Uncharacterized protein n=1 Tax=Phytophthora kernoviae TaxID=325452 RepID=A0A3F2RSE9_9STRA|nr:hypothetical protein BBJ29_007468 [Phytophthora kernoviae]RLN63352.1 hypothetical protein BBP00_00004197 [Phytophthora kernoviae]